MIDIFHYPQTFSRDIIESTFKKIFKKSGKYYQDNFLDVYSFHRKDFNKILDNIKEYHNEYKIFKTISTEYLEGDKHFEDYFIAYLYYKISNPDPLTQSISNAILKFHTQYQILREKEEDIDISSLVRYFVHIIEIAQVYFLHNKKEISITDIIDAIESGEIGLDVTQKDCSFNFVYKEQVYCVKSNIIVKNLQLRGFKSVFLNYYNNALKRRRIDNNRNYENIDTTKKNKHYVDFDFFTTKAKKNINPLSLEDQIEEDNNLKEDVQVKLGKNNTRGRQKKRILAISAAIAKNKLLLPSLYKIPSVGVLSKFLQFILEKKDLSSETQFYIGIFVIAIVMGIKPEQVISQFFSQKKEYTNDKNIVKLKLKIDLFAKFEQFDEKTGVKTQMEIEYKIPFELIHYIKYLRGLSIEFNDKKYKKYIKNLNERFEIEELYKLKISHSKIYNSTIVHKQLIHKTINTEILLATQNIDQNTTPRVAYTAISSSLSEYSSWLIEYMELLDIKDKLQKKIFGQVINDKKPTIINTDMTHLLSGSKKIVMKDAFVSFLSQIETILKRERRLDKYTRFNLYSIYVRFSLSLLLGTRDFKQSVDFDRISWSCNILIIKEKGKYKHSGYREVPLTELAKQIIKNYIETLQKLNIDKQAVVLYDNNKAVPATIANIKKVFYSFRFSKRYELLGKQFDAIPLNFGRHLITTIATNMNITIDDLNAFMGHGINGGELLGIYSFHNVKEYRKKFTKLIEEIEKSYRIKDIVYATGI